MNLDGELILLKSGKGFSRARISKFILDRGGPVIIASDKHPAPRFIERIASSFSARLIYPEENVSRLKKARMAKEFEEKNSTDDSHLWENQHEKDALVAVLFAWKRISRLMDRVDAKLRKSRRRKDFDQMENFVKSGVILHKRNIDSFLKRFKINKQQDQL